MKSEMKSLKSWNSAGNHEIILKSCDFEISYAKNACCQPLGSYSIHESTWVVRNLKIAILSDWDIGFLKETDMTSLTSQERYGILPDCDPIFQGIWHDKSENNSYLKLANQRHLVRLWSDSLKRLVRNVVFLSDCDHIFDGIWHDKSDNTWLIRGILSDCDQILQRSWNDIWQYIWTWLVRNVKFSCQIVIRFLTGSDKTNPTVHLNLANQKLRGILSDFDRILQRSWQVLSEENNLIQSVQIWPELTRVFPVFYFGACKCYWAFFGVCLCAC